ncbi:MAG: hypothetical protein P8P36_04765, partial [Akkermansiaceae bacterium]|nr:hypothetical protein [Akkermansiaceae bacterium]
MIRNTLRTITLTAMLFTTGAAFMTPLCAQNAQSKKPKEELSLKVMSYNIHRGGTTGGRTLSQTAKVIQLAKADMVGIQETKSPKGDTLEDLAKLLGWN